MKISVDLRFADLPCGGRTYVSHTVGALLGIGEPMHWRFYYNRWSVPQVEILERIQRDFAGRIEAGEIEFTAVRSGCLSVMQHAEFLFRRDDSDLYHYPHFDMPLTMRGAALVTTIHDVYPLKLAGYCSAAKRAYFYRVAGRNVRRCDRVIAVSDHTKQDIVDMFGISPEKITVIPNGYSPAYRPIDDGELLKKIRERYDLPERFILYVGTHKPHKNLDRLIEAFAGLDGGLRGEFSLVMTGPKTRDTGVLCDRAAEMGVGRQVRFLGMVADADMPGLYNLASLYVQPSLYEGFGLPLVEAMACGRPVIGSNVSAIPEVIGGAGRLFDPACVEEMRSVLREALEHDVDDASCRQRSVRRAGKFSWEQAARGLLGVYQEVAGSR